MQGESSGNGIQTAFQSHPKNWAQTKLSFGSTRTQGCRKRIAWNRESGGGTVVITDSKKKKGEVGVDTSKTPALINPAYGTSGEPAISVNGQIVSGDGNFTMSLLGFSGIDGVIDAPFTAKLVTSGDDNPFDLSLYGQGDQLFGLKNGTVSFVSKWHSADVLTLSDGSYIDFGDFFLNSSGNPTDFSFQLDEHFSGSGSFTIQEDYFFVNSLDANPSAGNLRQALTGGTVTEHATFSVPEPSTLALLGIAFVGVRFASRRKLNWFCRINSKSQKLTTTGCTTKRQITHMS